LKRCIWEAATANPRIHKRPEVLEPVVEGFAIRLCADAFDDLVWWTTVATTELEGHVAPLRRVVGVLRL